MVINVKTRGMKHARGKTGIVESRGDLAARWVSTAVITVMAFACLYPYLNVVAKSFSAPMAVMTGQVQGLLPKGFNTEAYKFLLYSNRFFSSMGNTLFVTLTGTALNLSLTIFVAYAVSRKNLPGGRFIMLLYIITMLFSGGMIPTYLVVVGAGLRNSLWSLIIPALVTPFNLVLMRNFFAAIPDSLEESAMMDGANHFTILFRIIVPLALPSIATITLFCAVSYWNSYFSALIYIDSKEMSTLQIYLREMLMSIQDAELNGVLDELSSSMPNESMRGAAVFASTLPIILVYPFLQKYYVQGMTLGAVKG